MKTGIITLGQEATGEDLLRLAREAALAGLEDPTEAIPEPRRRAGRIREDLAEPEIPTPGRNLFRRRNLYRQTGGCFEWFTMPDGAQVCVHPLSGDEQLWVQRNALREMKRSGVLDETGAPKRGMVAEYQAEAMTRGAVWTTLAVCRVGEALEDEKVFKSEDAAVFYEESGWIAVAEQIGKVSERLMLLKLQAQAQLKQDE